MRKLLISENERNQILNLHSKKITRVPLNESGCLCPDGTTNEMCCSKDEKTSPVVSVDPSKVIELENTVKSAQAQLDLINRQKDEQTKKEQIATLQKRFDDTYNRLISPEFNKMSKIQKNEVLNTKKQLETQLAKLQGLEVQQSTTERTADQKVGAWVGIASSILGLFTTLTQQFKKPE
jgi:hypothetical protein